MYKKIKCVNVDMNLCVCAHMFLSYICISKNIYLYNICLQMFTWNMLRKLVKQIYCSIKQEDIHDVKVSKRTLSSTPHPLYFSVRP